MTKSNCLPFCPAKVSLQTWLVTSKLSNMIRIVFLLADTVVSLNQKLALLQNLYTYIHTGISLWKSGLMPVAAEIAAVLTTATCECCRFLYIALQTLCLKQ